MKLDLKIVCINLERSTERRRHITDNVCTTLSDMFPFEFFTACDYLNLELKSSVDVTVHKDRIDVTFEDDNDHIPLRKIYYNDEFTGMYHNPRRYLEDQVEAFGRKHYRANWDVPYELTMSMADDSSDNLKKWIVRDGKPQFYVNVTDFRKKMTPPEIACSLSHYRVLHQLVNDPVHNAYLILEDDVSLQVEPAHIKTLVAHIELYEPTWDIVMLNHARFMTPNSLVKMTPMLNLSVFSTFTNACSYIIKKSTAATLLKRWGNRIDLTADDFLARQIDLRILRVVESCFTIGDDTFKSTIRTQNYI